MLLAEVALSQRRESLEKKWYQNFRSLGTTPILKKLSRSERPFSEQLFNVPCRKRGQAKGGRQKGVGHSQLLSVTFCPFRSLFGNLFAGVVFGHLFAYPLLPTPFCGTVISRTCGKPKFQRTPGSVSFWNWGGPRAPDKWSRSWHEAVTKVAPLRGLLQGP